MWNRYNEFCDSLYKKWWWLQWSEISENSWIEKCFYWWPRQMQRIVQAVTSVMLTKNIQIWISKTTTWNIKVSISDINNWLVNEEIVKSCMEIESILFYRPIKKCDVTNVGRKGKTLSKKNWKN